jgi:aldehyde dehydrogenase (NAD+)
MKSKLKSVKSSVERIASASAQAVVPLKERRLNFGDKWDYAPTPEDSKNYVIAPRHELFINGKFVAPASGKYFPSINPATEQPLTEIASANEQDVNSAVVAARRAYDKVWSKLPGRERGKYLYRLARIIQEKSRELAVLETIDGGKPIKESRDVDLPLVAAHFFYHAGWADKLKYAFPGKNRVRWGWSDRLFRGIFRSSWRPGKSRPRSPAGIPWF